MRLFTRPFGGIQGGSWVVLQKLETGIGGVKSPKIRGGVKILNFQGPLNLTLSYRDSIENRQFRGQSSKSSRGNFRGELPPPPLAFGTFWTPPIPVSEKSQNSKTLPPPRCFSALGAFGSTIMMFADESMIPISCPHLP